jgi:hypothetical protein
MLLTTCSKITHNFHINSSSGIQKDYISIPATNLLFAKTGQYITETQQYVYCLPVISLTYNLGESFYVVLILNISITELKLPLNHIDEIIYFYQVYL